MTRTQRASLSCRSAALAFLLLWPTAPAGAEVRRIEAVGAVSVSPARLKGLSSRDAAIRAALREAVERVATELLWESDLSEDFEESLERALGTDMAHFTTRFRILEDRGERPSLFSDDPVVSSEYVVVVEVHVDLDSVGQRLREHGLLAPEAAREEQRSLRVEVRGLRVYPAYRALRSALVEAGRARAVTPLALEAGRTLFAVDSDQTPRDLLDGLLAGLPAGLEIIPLRAGPDYLVLSASWTPSPEAAQEERDASPGDRPGRSAPGSVDSNHPATRRARRN